MFPVFRPSNQANTGGTIAVTNGSQTVTPVFSPTARVPMSILITNSGDDLIFVEFNADAAVTTSTPLLPNDKQVFAWNAGDSFGVIGATGGLSNCYWKLGYGA